MGVVFKRYCLLIVISNLFTIINAVNQDSIDNSYLIVKENAVAFMAAIHNQTFDAQLDSLHYKLIKADELEKSAFYIQFAKKHLKHKADIDTLLLMAEKNLLALNCRRGAAEAIFYKGLRAIKSQRTDEAHAALNEAAHLFQLANYPQGKLYAMTRLANYYSKVDNYLLAEKYNKEVLCLVDTIGDVNLREMAYLNVANFYMEKGEADEAITYYKLLEESLAQSNNTKRYKALYNNLGAVYIYKHAWEKANEYLLKSLALKEQEGDSLGMFASYQNLFKISLKNRELIKAKQYYSKMNELMTHLVIPVEQMLDFKYNTTTYHILTNSNAEALKEFQDYAWAKDSISNAVFAKELLALEEGNEIVQRDQAIELLQQKEELQNARVYNLKVIIGIVAVFVVVLLINGWYMKRQWFKLSEADKQLQLKQNEVITVNKRLETLNRSKDRILSVIGHDLRGPVGGLKELVELYMELPELEPQDITNLLKTARESSSGAYYLLENLLTWANSQRGEIEFKPMLTPVYAVVKKSIALLNQSINSKHVQFEININPSLSIELDVNMFRTILRNLVSNAIKHSNNNGLVEVNAGLKDDGVLFSVVDQGHGMSGKELGELFAKKEAYFISSEVSAKGSGLGLILCKEFVERHGGRIWIDSEEEIGTRVCFILPLNGEKRLSYNVKRASVVG